MSALQASRKYGVPSLTLYDKVKKMGILTANMQKQLQQKGKGAGPETPQKAADPGTLLPISLLGMQLPQAGLPALPPLQPVPVTQAADNKTNGDTHPPPSFTSKRTLTHTQDVTIILLAAGPFMLSMIEKIKAAQGKPLLGEAPLNLSAMLDTGHNGHGGQHNGHNGAGSAESEDNSRSGELNLSNV